VREKARRFLDLGTAVEAYRHIYENLRAPVTVEP
jgi:hypothetical protein